MENCNSYGRHKLHCNLYYILVKCILWSSEFKNLWRSLKQSSPITGSPKLLKLQNRREWEKRETFSIYFTVLNGFFSFLFCIWCAYSLHRLGVFVSDSYSLKTEQHDYKSHEPWKWEGKSLSWKCKRRF